MPLRTSPVPAVASARAAARADRPRSRRAPPRACRRPSARRSRPHALGRLARPLPAGAPPPPPRAARAAAPARPRAESGPSGQRCLPARSSPASASALRPSASIRRGFSIASARACASAKLSVCRARSRVPAPPNRPARSPPSPRPSRRSSAHRSRRPAARSSPRSASPRRSAFSEAGIPTRTQPAPARIAPIALRHTAPVRPVEPPTTSTAPELNFVELAPRAPRPARRPIADQSGGPRHRRPAPPHGDADVDRLDPAGMLLSRVHPQPDLRAMERDGHVGTHACSLHLAGGRVHTRGHVDRNDLRVRVVDRRDGGVDRRPRRSLEARAEQCVDDRAGPLERRRQLRGIDRSPRRSGLDERARGWRARPG